MMYGYGRGFDNGWSMMGAWGGGLMMLFWLIVLAGLVLLVVWAVRNASDHSHAPGGATPPAATGHDKAVAIAKKRFATGEITKEQYEEIMRTLDG